MYSAQDFAPALNDTILEDEDQQDCDSTDEELSSPKLRSGGDMAIEIMGHNVCSTIEQINNKLNGTIIKMFNQSHMQDQQYEKQDNNIKDISNADTKMMQHLSDSMRLYKELEARYKRMMSLPDGSPTKSMKIHVAKKVLDESLSIMERLSKSGSEESESANET